MRVPVGSLMAMCLCGSAWAAPADVLTVGEPGSPPVMALFWQPASAPPEADRVRAAFQAAIAARKGPAPIERIATPAPKVLLRERLAAAIADYRAFRFAEAAGGCSEVIRSAELHGGGDLDARQLADVYLYRGLARLELGQAQEAWDDVVRAARIDPARVLDPSEVPPRAAALYRRAAAEAAAAPHSQLDIKVPDRAEVHVDGRAVVGSVTLALGTHFVHVVAPGYEPWSQAIVISAAQQRIEPPLRPWLPPDPDATVEAAHAAGVRSGRVVLGALRRTSTGWRFLGRVVELPGGQTLTEEAALGAAPVDTTVATVIGHLLDPPVAVSPRGPRIEPHETPWYGHWWVWALAGAAVASAAIAVPLATSSSTTPTMTGAVTGGVPPLR